MTMGQVDVRGKLREVVCEAVVLVATAPVSAVLT